MAPSWIITLHAGASPALIPEPRGLMAQYDFFTSRTVEDGRERFRLHVGYFDDLSTAKSLLRLARETYPAAWLVPADHYPALRRIPGEPARNVPVRTTASEVSRTPATSATSGNPASTATAAIPATLSSRATADRQPEGGTVLGADEVFALLGGAADLLARVLPEVQLDDSGNAAGARVGLSAARRSGDTPDSRLADAMVRDLSRFIVEEWQPESRRPQRPPVERSWYARFRRNKGRTRSQPAVS